MHVLCRDPDVPLPAIQLAVQQYSRGALEVTNGAGLCPFHIAALSGADVSVLYYLLQQFPQALGQIPPSPPNNNNNNNNEAVAPGEKDGIAISRQGVEALCAERDVAVKRVMAEKDAIIARLEAQIESMHLAAATGTNDGQNGAPSSSSSSSSTNLGRESDSSISSSSETQKMANVWH